MATSTFERKIEITDMESIDKLASVMAKEAPEESLSQHPYTTDERKRSDRLLKLCLSRSEH